MNENKSGSPLETENLGTLMCRYSLPCIVSLLVGALYNIVDQIFIANANYLGSYGNAANTVVFPMTVAALAIATMIGDGCCAFVSISLGAGENENAHKGVGNSVMLITALGIALAILYIVFRDPILIAFGASVNAETYELSREYFFWISLGIPFYMFGQAVNPIIRSDGSPKFAMYSLLFGALANLILDPVFIFCFEWGMTGAAVATVIGQIISAALAFIYLFKMKALKLQKSSFNPSGRLLGRILPLGVTSFLSQISIVISMAAVLNMCRKYGALDPVFALEEYAQIPTAVVGIVMKFFQIVMSVAIGLSAGCIPIAGYNIGSGRKDRAKELMRRLICAEAAVGFVALIIFELFPGSLINIFGAKSESIYYTEFAVRCIRLYLCAVVFSCVNKGACIYLQALGKAFASTALSLLREIIFGVGLVLLLPLWFGLDGVLYFMAAADILTFGATTAALIRTNKELSVQDKASSLNLSENIRLTDKTGIVITVGRSFGAGGRTIAAKLSEIMDIPYYDAQLLSEAAVKYGLDRKFLDSIDEKAVQSVSLYSFNQFSEGCFPSAEQLAYRAQSEIIKEVASKGSCIIVGRRADRVLKERENIFSVFITASVESRVKRVSERDNISEAEARQKIERADKERSRYYNLLSENKWGEAGAYDLCIDTDKFGLERAAYVIAECIKKLP